MSESKTPWTPGPWTVTDNSWETSTVYSHDGNGVIAVCPIDGGVDEWTQDHLEAVKEANARLIACAPEMAEALEVFSRALGSVADTDTTHWPDNDTIEHSGAAEEITWGDLRRARALLAKIGCQS